MFLARGASFLLSTESIPITAPFYTAVSEASLRLPGGGRLTVIAAIMLAVFVVGGLALHLTRFGTAAYALGGNRVSARLMGLRTGASTVAIYTLSSALAGLAGIVFSLYTSSGNSLSAVGVELDTIAAVVIGGTLLTGGQGLMVGTFLGVMIQALIGTYITFDGTLSSWWAKIATGALLFVFIALQQGLSVLAGRARRPGRTSPPRAAAPAPCPPASCHERGIPLPGGGRSVDGAYRARRCCFSKRSVRVWRKGWDSNPRWSCPHGGFQRPLP